MSPLSALCPGALCLKIIVIIGGCPPRKRSKKPPLLSTTCIPPHWKFSPSLLVVWVQAIAVVLVFTYMESHAIAPSHHRERKIWQYASLIPKQYSSAINNTVSKINATFLWRPGFPGGGILHQLCSPSLPLQHALSVWVFCFSHLVWPVCVITVVLFSPPWYCDAIAHYISEKILIEQSA